MDKLYSVDATNGDKEQFSRVEGSDDYSGNDSQALEDGADEDGAEQEEPEGSEPAQTVEDVLALSVKALQGVKPKDITKAIGVLNEVDDERKVLNETRKEAVEILEALGYPRKALYALHARCKADPLVRAAIDPAYNFGCDVMDVKLQSEMFPKH